MLLILYNNFSLNYIKRIFIIACLATAIACTEEPLTENRNPAVVGRTIEVNMPTMTRTALGEGDEKSVSLVWCEGDEIAVIEDKGTANQKHSVYRLVGEGGSATGVFEYVNGDAVEETITDVVYPASAVSNNFSVPQDQIYVEGSFDPEAMVMSWTRTGSEEPIILEHKAAVFMLTLKGKSQKVSSVEISTGEHTYKLVCQTAMELSGEGMPFYIVVPGNNDRLTYDFSINATLGVPMNKTATCALPAGRIGRLPATEFVPIAIGDVYKQGLVFEVTEEYAKVVSLDESSCKWASSNTAAKQDIGTEVNPEDGFYNTNLFKNFDLNNYPAAKWCIEHGEGWYMPSRAEINRLIERLGLDTTDGLTSVNSLLTAAGGTGFSFSSYLWTSCESDKEGETEKVYLVRPQNKGTTRLNKYSSSTDRPVRAVKKVWFTGNLSDTDPDFGDKVKELPEAGSDEAYYHSPSGLMYRPVATKYAKTWSSNPTWINAEARIVPYISGFGDYEMTREEYMNSTNKYGSSTLLPRQEATGRFYVKKIGDRFWLVDPEGYLHHHRGVASLRPSKDAKEGGNDDPAFIQKYGNRETWLNTIQDELAGLGFHSSGAFSTVYDEILKHNENHPDRPILLCPSFGFLINFKNKYQLTYCTGENDTAICLVLDENWGDFCKDFISNDMKKYLNNANVIGFFSDNEINFSSLSSRLLDRVLNSENTTHPAYIAAEAFMTDKNAKTVTDALNDEWVGMLAEKYYKGIREALDKCDPGLLYFGSRLHGVPKMKESIIRAANKNCDVISINYYSYWDVDTWGLVKMWQTCAPDTPFMVSEFYTKADDSGLDNSTGAGFLVPTQQDRAFAYQHITLGLLETKNCVGWHYFKYQDDSPAEYDNPANKGLYDNNYELYPWMAEYSKMLNYNTYKLIDFFDNIHF